MTVNFLEPANLGSEIGYYRMASINCKNVEASARDRLHQFIFSLIHYRANPFQRSDACIGRGRRSVG